MARVRVYELARELEVDSKTLISKLKDLKIEVSGHQSTLTALQVNKIKEDFASKTARKVVVRRRRKVASAAPVDSAVLSKSEEKELPSTASPVSAEVVPPVATEVPDVSNISEVTLRGLLKLINGLLSRLGEASHN